MSIIRATLPDDTILYRWGEPKLIYPERAPKYVGGSVTWVNDSPFGVSGVDCRPISFGSLSVFSDLSIPETFARVRELTGEAYKGQLPEGTHEVNCSLSYPTLTQHDNAQLFVPEIFEDRWVILKHDQRIYFISSYTGTLHLVAETVDLPIDGMSIPRIWCEEGVEGEFAMKQTDFLIKSHVLDRWCPHPIPPELDHNPEDIAHDAWLTYGRRGWFATNADTVSLDVNLKRWPDEDSK